MKLKGIEGFDSRPGYYDKTMQVINLQGFSVSEMCFMEVKIAVSAFF
jgi:hypothetical protein